MFHVSVRQHLCIGAGLCVLSTNAVFDQDEDSGLVVLLDADPPPPLHDKVRGAARKCPALAIAIEESEPAATLPT